MIDVVAAFVAHVKIIYIVSGLLTGLGYAAYRRRRFRISGVISAGFFGAGVPVGALLILTAFRPGLTDELREFPLEIGILGLVYILYAVREIRRIYNKRSF